MSIETGAAAPADVTDPAVAPLAEALEESERTARRQHATLYGVQLDPDPDPESGSSPDADAADAR